MLNTEPHVTDPVCPDVSLPNETRFEVVYSKITGKRYEGRCPVCGDRTVLNGPDGVGYCQDHEYVNLPRVEE